MESLEFDPPTVRQITESRSDLWYGQYQWSLQWYQPEISVIRGQRNPQDIIKILATRRSWEKTRYDQHGMAGRLKPSFVSKITPEVEKNVLATAKHFRETPHEHKVVLSSDSITVYTNSQEFLHSTVSVATAVGARFITCKTADPCLEPNTVTLKRPYDYGYRTWFRARRVTDETKKRLRDWVGSMGAEVYASPSFLDWLHNRNRPRYWQQRSDWTLDHYFIDHNDAKLNVWMAMVSPGLIRKTQVISSPAK